MYSKTILITNDDGIFSPGIKAAIEALKDLARIVIVAPAYQQSGISRAISLTNPVFISKVNIYDVESYICSGTPVDCIIVGIFGILKKKPDLVISGINLGENLSYEITTSGTVAAAIEAANLGVKSIAISQEVEEVKKFEDVVKEDFTHSKRVLRTLIEEIFKRNLEFEVLNVNVPKNPRDYKIKITRLARKYYNTSVEERRDPRGRRYFWINGDNIIIDEKNTDVYVLKVERRISITPLKLDLTDYTFDSESLRNIKIKSF